jgi:hypothetical protein
LDYQIKDGDLLDSWLFFLASCSLSERDASSEIMGGQQWACPSCWWIAPNIYLQAEAVYQTLRKELVLTLREAVESEK